MNLRHVPSLKASKRGYQIIFVLPIIVLSSLFSTCSGCGDLPETLEFNYPEIVGTVNSPLGDIPPQWRGTPEAGTAYVIAPDLPEGLTLDPSTGIISGTAKVIVEAGQYTITATFPSGGTKSVKISLRTEGSIDTPPDAPSNVEAAAGVGTIAVTWEDPADTGILGGEKAQITGFKIYYSENQIDTAQDTPLGFSDLTKDRRVTITGLINGTAYSIAVAAVTEAGEGELSTPVTAVPKALLSITSYGENEIGLTWNGPADSIDEYRVYYAASTINDVDDAGVESETFTETSMTITGLTAGTRYYFKGTAFSGTGESTVSPEVDAYTNSPPGMPVNIQASTTGGGEITVSWDSPLPGYFDGSAASVSYKVYYHIGGLTETDLPSLTPEAVNTGRRHVLTNLQKGSTYFVTVIASNDLGDSAMPPSVGAAPFGANRPPGAAASVTIDSSTETGISLSWTAPVDTGLINDDGTPGIITAYRIYYSETQSFTIDGQTAMSEVGSTAEASIDNLNSGTPYYFKIAAANAVGWGNASDVVTGYTTGRAGAPANVSADPGTTADSEVTLTWDAPADRGIEDSGGTAGTITGYRVYYAASPINDVNDVEVTGIDAQGTSQKIASGLTAGTRYYFKVAAVNGIGEGTVSLEADTYTNSVPGEPSNILSIITGVGKITVTWDEPSPGYYAGSAASVRYRVYYKTDNLVETDLPSLNPEDVDAGRIQVLTNLRIDQPYFITVIASNVLGDSAMPASVKTRQGWESRPPGVPTSVAIDSSPENGIELSWTPPADTGIVAAKPGTIIGYKVYYSKAPIFAVNGEGINSQTTTVNSISFTTFDRGTRYYFKVTAANGIGSGNASNEVTSFTTAGPGAPTNVAADPGTRADSEVTLTWAAPVDKGIEDGSGTVGTITGYKVYYAASTINDLTAAGLGTQTSTGTSMTITGLAAGTRYYFKVAAVTGIGEGTASTEADTYTNSLPGVPSNIQAAQGIESLTVSWDAPSAGYLGGNPGVLSYKVYHSTADITSATDLAALTETDASTDTEVTLSSLTGGTPYYLIVIANNGYGDGSRPTAITGVPWETDRPPGAPTSAAITSSSEDGMDLSWTAPADTGIEGGSGAKGTIKDYEVYYSKTPNFAIGDTGVNSKTETTTSFSLTSLDSGTRYYFKVTAANDSGSGNPSAEIGGYTTSRPGAPTAVAADPGTTADNEVTLTWDAPDDTGIKDSSGAADDITGYKVYYADSTISDVAAAGVKSEDSAGTSKTITGLTAGTQYYFKVTAANSIGEGTASSEADTYTNSLPGVPSNIQAAQGVESLTVSWDAPSAGYLGGNPGSLSYKVYHSTADITSGTDLTTLTETEVTSGTTATLSSLTGGTTYYLIVIANNGYGDGPRPASINKVPWETNRVPGVPTSVTVGWSTETGIELSWTAPADTGL